MTEDRRALRVLVVDDAEDLRLVVRLALEREGTFVVVGEAGDGRAAIEAAQALQPDIVLLDLAMPRVGGLEALPEIRAAAPEAQVVVLTGLPRHDNEPAARAAGAVGYLEKGVPSRRLVDELVSIGGLLETVDDVLAEQRAALDADPVAPRSARRFVDETLRRWDCADALGTVALLVTELVTNALVHARSAPEVVVILRRDRIRVEVSDRSASLPVVRAAKTDATSGRGLALVERLSADWGVAPAPDGGKVVWFEVPRLDDDAAPVIE